MIINKSPPKLCECCREIPLYWIEDHDHKTNVFRGWICKSCDSGIKLLGDNLKGVVKAVMYLESVKLDRGLRPKSIRSTSVPSGWQDPTSRRTDQTWGYIKKNIEKKI